MFKKTHVGALWCLLPTEGDRMAPTDRGGPTNHRGQNDLLLQRVHGRENKTTPHSYEDQNKNQPRGVRFLQEVMYGVHILTWF